MRLEELIEIMLLLHSSFS